MTASNLDQRLFHKLYTWPGYKNVVNYIVIDPSRMTSKSVSMGGEVAAVRPYSEHNRDNRINNPELAQFVTVGVVSRSNLLSIDREKKCKFVTLNLPSLFVDRLQTLCYISFGRLQCAMCAQASRAGIDFTTRREYHSHCFQFDNSVHDYSRQNFGGDWWP